MKNLEKTDSSEFFIQRVKCFSQNDGSTSSRPLNQKWVQKLSEDGMNAMGENIKNTCRCKDCLGYEFECQNMDHPDENITDSQNISDVNNNNHESKYNLYAKLTKKTDNSQEKFLYLKYKGHGNNQEDVNSTTHSNVCKCSSKNCA